MTPNKRERRIDPLRLKAFDLLCRAAQLADTREELEQLAPPLLSRHVTVVWDMISVPVDGSGLTAGELAES